MAGAWLLIYLAVAGRSRPGPLKGVTVLAVLVALATLYLVPWSPRKPFLRSFSRIQAGMSAQEVATIMGGYMRESQGQDLWSFRHSNSGHYDSDVALVYFREDRVLKKEFLAD